MEERDIREKIEELQKDEKISKQIEKINLKRKIC